MKEFPKEYNVEYSQEGPNILLERRNIQNKRIEKKTNFDKNAKVNTKYIRGEHYICNKNVNINDYKNEFPSKWKKEKKKGFKVATSFRENVTSPFVPNVVRNELLLPRLNLDEYVVELEKMYFPKNKNADSILKRIENETANVISILTNNNIKVTFIVDFINRICKYDFISNPLLNLFNDIGKEAVYLQETLKPSLIEINMRKEIIQKIKNVCKHIYKKFHFVVFGSCNTALDMYNSDIDICIYTDRNVSDKKEVRYLYYILHNSVDFKHATVKMICGASVPIIKCFFHETRISLDISFNRLSSIVSTIEVQKSLKENKLLKYVITFFKVLLANNDLNDASKGGLSSFRFFLILQKFMKNNNFVFTQEQPYLYIGEFIFKFSSFFSMFKDKSGLVPFLRSLQGNSLSSLIHFKLRRRKVWGSDKECFWGEYSTSNKNVQDVFFQVDVPACESVPLGKIKFLKILDVRNCFKNLYYKIIELFILNVKDTNLEIYCEYKDMIFQGNCDTIAFLNTIGEEYLNTKLKELYQIGILLLDYKRKFKRSKGMKEDNKNSDHSDSSDCLFFCDNENCDDPKKTHCADEEKKQGNCAEIKKVNELFSEEKKKNNELSSFGIPSEIYEEGKHCFRSTALLNTYKESKNASHFKTEVSQLVSLLRKYLSKNENSHNTLSDHMKKNKDEQRLKDQIQGKEEKKVSSKLKNYTEERVLKRPRSFSDSEENLQNRYGDECCGKVVKKIKKDSTASTIDKKNTQENFQIISKNPKKKFSWLVSEKSNKLKQINIEDNNIDFCFTKMKEFDTLIQIHKTTEKVTTFVCSRLNTLSHFLDLKKIINERFRYYVQHKNQFKDMKFDIKNGNKSEDIQNILSDLSMMKHYDKNVISEFAMNCHFLF